MVTRVLAFLVVVSALAGVSAAAQPSDAVDLGDELANPELARLVAAGELPIGVLFLPPGFQGAIPSVALQGVDDVAATSLPGPDGALLPSGDDGRSIFSLLSHSGVPGLNAPTDLAGLLAAPGAGPTASTSTQSPSTTATPTSSDATPATGDASTGTGSYAPDPTETDAPSTHAAATGASRGSGGGVVDAWNDLSPEQRTAVAAGALGLLLMAPFAMYSRIKRDEALKNPTRARIYEIVCTTPGLCKKDIAARSDVSYSTATYHLDRLEKDNYVVEMDEGNRVTYFKNGGRFSPAERELVPVLKNEEAMRVLETVLANPWCYRAQVAEMLGVSHTTVNWHLKRLADAGLVAEHREGRACHLMVPDDALERLERVMDKLDGTETPVQIAEVATITA